MAPKDINTMAPNLKRDITTGPSPLLYYYRVCQLIIEDRAMFSKKPSNVWYFFMGQISYISSCTKDRNIKRKLLYF